jgi:RND family efflux transporter MFP subunit
LSQPVRLRIEGGNEIYKSELNRLSPIISSDNRMLIVEADFNNPEGVLRPGSFGKVEIVVDAARQTLFVPANAVVTFAGMQKIFVVENGKAFEREVRCGRTKGQKIEIISGLKPATIVVVEPGNLRNGQDVETGKLDT